VECGRSVPPDSLWATPRPLDRLGRRPRATLSSESPIVPQALEQRLEELTEKLRSGATARVREAIRASAEKIMEGPDRSLTLEVKPDGLPGGARLPLHK
jgi:hypothetical protein